MAGDRKKQGYERCARPQSAVPEEFADEDKTPLPVNADEAFGWQRIDSRMVAVEAAVRGITPDITRHEESIRQWSAAAQECLVDIAKASERLEGIETNLGRDWKRFSDSLDTMSKALGDIGNRLTKLEAAVDGIGKQQIDQAAKLIVLTERVDKIERADRDRQVATGAVKAEHRRLFSLANAGYVVASAIGAGLVALAHYL